MSVSLAQIGFQPLNPTLYRALKDRFGSVVIANEGDGMQFANLPNIYGGRNASPTRMEIIVAGEYYRVCCPYCNENRHRLWINHQFAQPGPNGFPQLWLAHCYNEQCVDNYDRRRDLEDKIFGFRNANVRSRGFQVLPGVQDAQSIGPVKLPGEVFRLNELPSNHPAAVYMRDDRRHNLDYLSNAYGVAYCHNADPEHRICQGRIVIPIWQGPILAGWQVRAIGEPNFGPKYYGMPGMPKRLMLYNIDTARQWPFVCVVEGVTSVWRLQGPAVALLGKTMSARQQYLIHETWPGKPVILILDPDARDEMEGIIDEMRRAGKVRVVPVFLEGGMDPDNFEHETIVDIIRAQASRHGCDLPAW